MKAGEIWPNFFIVGAPKAGTTSLYQYLKAHPGIFLSPNKEPHFFSQLEPDRAYRHLHWIVSGKRDYLKLFQPARGFSAIGEASPSYLVTESAAARIKEAVPNAKIIILLRDPIERAYSHYLMDVREGIQNLGFYEALQRDWAAPRKGWGISRLYVEEGLYFANVRRYLDVFGAGNVLTLQCEDLAATPAAGVSRVIEFLGLSSADLRLPPVSVVHNPHRSPRNAAARLIKRTVWLRLLLRSIAPAPIRSFLVERVLFKPGRKPPIDQNAVRFLRPLFQPDTIRLEELLGRSLRFETLKGRRGNGSELSGPFGNNARKPGSAFSASASGA